jgi:hypothetical protein
VLQFAGLLPDHALWLESQVGDFLKDLEKTSMTKSFKMVVLLAMCVSDRFSRSIEMDDLIRFFRGYFSQERHRSDVAGTVVEDVEVVSDAVWQRYLLSNPINAWTGGNQVNATPHFSWNESDRTFRYVGPVPAGKVDAEAPFMAAVRDRVTARLQAYWVRPGPGKFVFSVIPTGDGNAVTASERGLCIMFGKANQRSGLPEGWHPVRINGLFFYGKFVKVALNVLKDKPIDDRAVPNVLTQQLRQLLSLGQAGNALPPRPRVRLNRSSSAATWEIVAT